MIETKYLVAGGVALAAVIGALIWRPRSVKDDDMLKLKLDVDKKKYYDKGFKEGSEQGTAADRGKASSPVVTLNEAENGLAAAAAAAKAALPGASYVAAVQQSYENGVNDGFEKYWVAPEPIVVPDVMVPDVIAKDVVPVVKDGGMKEGQTAYDYGCSRGGSRGWSDGYGGETCDPSGYLLSDHSKVRQIESGDPAAYRNGYKDCYVVRCAAGAEAKAVADVFGYEPATGALLRVGGVRVLGIRGAYSPPILTHRGLSTSAFARSSADKCYAFGVTRGKADRDAGRAFDLNGAFKYAGTLGYDSKWGVSERVACRENIARGYRDGFGSNPAFEAASRQSSTPSTPSASPAQSMETVERYGRQPPPPPVAQAMSPFFMVAGADPSSVFNYPG